MHTTELRTCGRRTVKAVSVLFHNVVMGEWWSKNNKGQRVKTREEHSGINMSSRSPTGRFRDRPQPPSSPPPSPTIATSVSLLACVHAVVLQVVENKREMIHHRALPFVCNRTHRSKHTVYIFHIGTSLPSISSQQCVWSGPAPFSQNRPLASTPIPPQVG